LTSKEKTEQNNMKQWIC